MSSRKKLIVSLSVVALVVIAAVVAVVGVFAAANQTVESQVYITFTAVDIDGDVFTNYKVQTREDAGKIEQTDLTKSNVVTFAAKDSTVSGAIGMGSTEAPIEIRGREEALYIEYNFGRKSVDYKASVSFADHGTFYAEYFDTTNSKWETLTSSPKVVLASFGNDNFAATVLMRISAKESALGTNVTSAININWALSAL